MYEYLKKMQQNCASVCATETLMLNLWVKRKN